MALVVPTVLVVAFSCSPAQEPRASQPAPPPQRDLASAPMPLDRMTERQPWLGVQAEPIRSDVAMQLPLRKGAGLVVTFVEADSPAEKAGLQRFDILEMVGDQFLMNVDQFSGLVKSEQPGAKIKLTWRTRLAAPYRAGCDAKQHRDDHDYLYAEAFHDSPLRRG